MFFDNPVAFVLFLFLNGLGISVMMLVTSELFPENNRIGNTIANAGVMLLQASMYVMYFWLMIVFAIILWGLATI